ncbi:ATP-binding protein [Buchnera aphidicola]|uniref:ATP-binding protein n=1 Tax=Buchnera aphidicola TaxID=9 RepID=UPI003464E74E
MAYNINLLQRLKNIIPNHIQPKFQYGKELLHWNYQEGILFSQKTIQENDKIKKKNILEKSGIRQLYLNCSFENYQIKNEKQKKIVKLSKQYAKNFHNSFKNFIFLGTTGTGKNHLAAAIGNYLIEKGKKILLITIADLMSNVKKTFNNNNKNFTEEKIIHYLSTVDLLIFDEIGIQTESKYEKIILHQIIKRRYSCKKPIGILSNLFFPELKKILGEQIIDRINTNNSLVLYFTWNSHRK